jgi:hypothetical protein
MKPFDATFTVTPMDDAPGDFLVRTPNGELQTWTKEALEKVGIIPPDPFVNIGHRVEIDDREGTFTIEDLWSSGSPFSKPNYATVVQRFSVEIGKLRRVT